MRNMFRPIFIVVAIISSYIWWLFPRGIGDGEGLNHYQQLGVERTATKQEIRKAFRKLSIDLHPDKRDKTKGGDLGEKKYIRLTQAMNVLADPQKRKEYDNELEYQVDNY